MRYYPVKMILSQIFSVKLKKHPDSPLLKQKFSEHIVADIDATPGQTDLSL